MTAPYRTPTSVPVRATLPRRRFGRPLTWEPDGFKHGGWVARFGPLTYRVAQPRWAHTNEPVKNDWVLWVHDADRFVGWTEQRVTTRWHRVAVWYLKLEARVHLKRYEADEETRWTT